ncbi:hypothetical protein WA158_000180 [Blastocystis sp. Blastoise]
MSSPADIDFCQEEPNEEVPEVLSDNSPVPQTNASFLDQLQGSKQQPEVKEIKKEDSAFFNQIEPESPKKNNLDSGNLLNNLGTTDIPLAPMDSISDLFAPETKLQPKAVEQSGSIFKANAQTEQLGFAPAPEPTTTNVDDLLNPADFSYPVPSAPTEINWMDTLDEKTRSLIPMGIDPAKAIVIKSKLDNYVPDEDTCIARIDILYISELINQEEQNTLLKLLFRKRNLVEKALDINAKTGSMVLLNELLGRNRDEQLPNAQISVDEMGTETLSIPTLSTISGHDQLPERFIFCTTVLLRNPNTLAFFSKKWDDIFIMIGNEEINVYHDASEAVNFEDPTLTIRITPFMEVSSVITKSYSGIPMYVVKLFEINSDYARKNNIYYYSDEYPHDERLKLGSTEKRSVTILKTQIEQYLNVLKQQSMKAAERAQQSTFFDAE